MQYIKSILLVIIIGLLAVSCQLGQQPKSSEKLPQGFHKGVVKEVLQTSNYTYLLINENNTETWIALPKMEAETGETYYYAEGMEMTDFESKELGRTFKSVFFVESVSTSLGMNGSEHVEHGEKSISTGAITSEKQSIQVQPAEGGITIAKLFENKAAYAGKSVRIKGQVTKFNSAIMNNNWVHLQDGTEFSGKFDLTVTTEIEVAVGDIVTFEGVLALDKDFGYGYSYEILLEKAVLIKEM